MWSAEPEESRREPGGFTAVQYEMPERLRRQVAPAPIDPQKRYELDELIDLAERVNPDTRVAWEVARQAAIAMGLGESEYFPVLTLAALGGYRSTAFPAPRMSRQVDSSAPIWSKSFRC